MLASGKRKLCFILTAALLGVCPWALADSVTEAAHSIPVAESADVVVIGGGLSGVGAAWGAASHGAKTLVVERTGYLGGWIRGEGLGATVGSVGWRPSLNEGVLLDITKRVVAMHAEGYPDLTTALNKGLLVLTNQELLPQAFQSLLLEKGVKLLYFASYSSSIMRDGKIEAIIVETPVGRVAIRGKVFVDCTGLATVAANSGAPVKKAEAAMGLACIITHVDTDKYSAYQKSLPAKPDPEARQWLEAKLGYKVTEFRVNPGSNDISFPWDDWLTRYANVLGVKFRQAVDSGEMPLFYRVGAHGIVGSTEGLKVTSWETTGGIARPRTFVTGVDPTDIMQLSEAHALSAEYLFKLMDFLQKNIPGFEHANLTRIADVTLNRAGRSIVSDPDPEAENIDKAVEHPDAIAVLQRGRKSGLYEVPYSSMIPDKIDNLLAVGKSSSGGIKFRTHMLAVIMGQAAGTAAAMAEKDGISPRNVPIVKLQEQLRNDGILIPKHGK